MSLSFRVMRHVISRTVSVTISVCVLTIPMACGEDSTGPSPGDPSQLFGRLQLNYTAVTLSLRSPQNTVQLEVVPLTLDGNPIETEARAVFSVGTDTSVLVDSLTGFVTAHGPTAGVTVRAMLTIAGVTLLDTVRIAVVDLEDSPVPRPFRLKLEPQAGRELHLNCKSQALVVGNNLNDTLSLTSILTDDGGNVITSTLVTLRSQDTTLATVDAAAILDPATELSVAKVTPRCVGGRRGAVWIYATGTVYGVTLTDSVRVTVGAPRYANVQIDARGLAASDEMESYFKQSFVTIEAGGTVVWMNYPLLVPPRPPAPATDVTFENPEVVAAANESVTFIFLPIVPTGESGNIPQFQPDTANAFSTNNFRVRRFPTPGVYRYRSTRFRTEGTVEVVPRPL